MKEHDLKTWPREFDAVADCSKRFEYRKDDRGFEVGDVLILHEWEPQWSAERGDTPEEEGYTGRVLRAHVTYVLRGPDFGVVPGHVIMSILPDPLGEPWNV